MSRVFIGRRFDDTLLVVSAGLCAVGLFGGGWYLARTQTTPPLAAVACWLALLLVALGRFVWIASDRRRMSPAVGGVILTARGASHFIPHEAVTALGFWNRPHYDWGSPRYQLVTGELTVGDGPDAVRVPFAYRYGLEDCDPLWGWRAELIEHLAERAAGDIARGGAFATDHWALDRTGLSWLEQGVRRHIPAEEIAAADTADGAFCVWRAGEERPEFRLPHGSCNAMPLWEVLARSLGDAPRDPPAADGLGRVLCDRPLGEAGPLRFLLYFFALALAAGGVAIATLLSGGWPVQVFGGFVAAGGIGLFALCWVESATVLTIHTGGVSLKRRFGTRRIPFAELGEMSWQEIRSYVQGVYVGTTVQARLVGYDGTVVRFRMSVKNVDFDLNELRATAARHVADRLRGHLARGRQVPWVGRFRFTPDGLAVAPWLPLFGGRERVLPYHSLDWEMAGGRMTLRCGRRRVGDVIEAGAVNFWPGLLLLEHLRVHPDGELAPLRRA